MKYDAIVIGSGPGGYVCAIRLAQLGLKTAIIERYKTLGGTCLNVGCIPSKALLDSSEHYHNALTRFSTHGISTGTLNIDMAQMQKRKQEVVSNTIEGINYLMKKNKINVHNGHASFVDSSKIVVKKDDGTKEEMTADRIIIATGSKPATLPSFNYDKERIITSTEALNLGKIPKSMIVIGGGVIGLELGSVYSRLGSEIAVVEFMDSILPEMDADVSREMNRILKKQDFQFYLKHRVDSVKKTRGGISLQCTNMKDNEKIELKAEYCMIPSSMAIVD